MQYPEPIELIPQPGYIYLIRLDSVDRVEFKIGMTRNLKNRVSTLYCQTGMYITPIAYGYTNNAHFAESQIQHRFIENCIHGEYFRFNCGQIWQVLKEIESFCGEVFTDYTTPRCIHDNSPLISRWRQQNFRCPSCGEIIPFDRYMPIVTRMLPYCCDETNDDDGLFINDKYDSIYNTTQYL